MTRQLLCLVLAACVLLCSIVATPITAYAIDRDTYRVEVDITNQITTVYRTADNAIVRQMLCSTGTGTRTPLGTFRMPASRPTTDRVDWYYITKYKCYVKYATRIKDSILFHSIPYAKKDMETIDQEALAQLGEQASHGCIRLLWEDARWVSENCPEGTVVRIFNGAAKKTGLRDLLRAQGYTEDCKLTYRQFIDSSPVQTISSGLGRGSTGDEVTALQNRLIGLGFFTEAASGIYDEHTTIAVMRYQAAAGETVNGVANRALIEKIMAEKDVIAEYSTLLPGCSGPLVARLQNAMAAIGCYSGAIDGIYGDDLARAISGYCASRGINPVQSVTPAMRADIYRAAKASPVNS